MGIGGMNGNWRDLARELRAEGKYNRALDLFMKAREWFPHDDSLLRETSGILFRLDRIEEAITLHETFLETEPENGSVWNDLGALRFEMRHHPSARLSFREAIRFRGRKSDYLCNLANACIETGLKREAIRLLREVLELNPLDLRAHCLLGIQLENRDHPWTVDPVKIGQRLDISRSTLFSGAGEGQEWTSRVEDLVPNTLRISCPTSGWRSMPMRRGTRIILGYTGPDALWGAIGEVTGIVLDNVPLLEVQAPSAFRRIQRRGHVRITRGKTLRRIVLPGGGAIRFREENLSATGVGVSLPAPIGSGAVVSLEMNMEGETIQVEGRVVRHVPLRRKGSYAGIAFTDMDEVKRERLARYIHRLQLDWQKRRIH